MQPAQLDDHLRKIGVPVFQLSDEVSDPGRALRSDHAVLGQVTPKRVDHLRALAHQQVTGAKEHPMRLLSLGLDRHEVHGATTLDKRAGRQTSCGEATRVNRIDPCYDGIFIKAGDALKLFR